MYTKITFHESLFKSSTSTKSDSRTHLFTIHCILGEQVYAIYTCREKNTKAKKPTLVLGKRFAMTIALADLRILFFSSTCFSVCSVFAEGMQLNPAGQGLCCMFPTLTTRSDGSWDDHLMFFLSTMLLGVGFKKCQRIEWGQMK